VNRKFAKSLYLFLQTLRREDVRGILSYLEGTQHYPTERLLDMQWRRFTQLLGHAYENIPYYRRTLTDAGIEPGDIRSRGDLAAIPMLTKADVRANFADLQARGPGLVEKTSTSGSTGEPLRVIRDRVSTGYHRANMFRLRRWYGSDIGGFEATFRVFNYPFWERQMTRLKDFILNRIRINEHELLPEHMLEFYQRLAAIKPDVFYGFPSLMVRFAQFLERHGIESHPFSLKVIITTSEMLYPRQKEILGSYFGAPVANEYGCTETGIIAIECPEGGWHVPVESTLIEIIPAGDLEADEGVGRVIVTDLMNRAMPFIRYDIGNLARKGVGRCTCGRGLPTIEGVAGRVGRMIDLPDGRSIHSITFFNIFRKAEKVAADSVKEFQVQHRPPRTFEFLIVPDRGFNDDVMAYIRGRVEDALGKGCELKYELVDDIIPSSNGKLEKFVIVEE
jgi:phenylacetate-CoA ligase